MDTPEKEPIDVMAIARMSTVIIGSKKSVLDKLNELYPLEVKSETNPNPKFYSDMPFEAQIEKLLNFNKYKNSHFVYGIMYFYENDNSPERAKIVKEMNLPEEVANYRIQRVELHR
jgi:hypothetical protein